MEQYFRNLGIVMYISYNCPFCQKMIKTLHEEGLYREVTLYDVDSDEETKFPGIPLPTLITKDGKISVGNKSIKEVLESFENDPNETWNSFKPK
jgi:glutaredoxin